jgi:hypothetical protein
MLEAAVVEQTLNDDGYSSMMNPEGGEESDFTVLAMAPITHKLENSSLYKR